MSENIKKLVLFDLDGTLLDTLGDLTGAVNHILEKLGYPTRSAMEVRSYLGNGARELVRLALPHAVEDKVLDEYLERYKKYYNAHSKIETKPYDGVVELLVELKRRGICTAVVSNKPDFATKELCREYFGGLIDFAIGDRADVERKPAADPILLAMKTLDCGVAVHVGDSEVDVETAKNAGIPCVAVKWGFRDADVLEKAGAEYFAVDADELKAHLFKLIEIEDN